MANFMMTCFAVLCTFLVATAKLHETQAAEHKTMLVSTAEVTDQELVICNAYASQHPLDVVSVRTRKSLTNGVPLAYKQCKDFTIPLQEGDQLDFKAGNLDVGTFYATGLPTTSASLLLIPHRRSPHAVGVSFESHAFANLKNPQIAVIDAYRSKGKNDGAVKIIEAAIEPKSKDTHRVEENLKFNSVVAVNPGNYDISLTGSGGAVASTVPLHAHGASKYVVMRLGVEDDDAKSGKYPQELVVFPNSAPRLAGLSVSLLMAALAFVRM